MKKTLLFAVLSIAGYSNAQSLTQANEPAILDSESMYLCDSFALNYAGITGSGVTWDYTGLTAYPGEMRTVDVTDATIHPNTADFPGATKVINIGNLISIFFNSTATDRMSQGFLFVEPTFGNVLGKIAADPEQLATYPFAFGNSLSNTFSGTLETAVGNNAITGVVFAEIDGEGTLDMPNAVSLANVIRYKLIDTATALGTLLGDLELIRNQYDYYDHTVSNLPVLSFITVKIQNVGAGAPISEQTMVLSSYAPAGYIGIEEEQNNVFTIYPNPSKDEITINGEFESGANVFIYDLSGKSVMSSGVENGSVINISNLENGTYIIAVENNGTSTKQSFVKI